MHKDLWLQRLTETCMEGYVFELFCTCNCAIHTGVFFRSCSETKFQSYKCIATGWTLHKLGRNHFIHRTINTTNDFISSFATHMVVEFNHPCLDIKNKEWSKMKSLFSHCSFTLFLNNIAHSFRNYFCFFLCHWPKPLKYNFCAVSYF